MNHPLQRANIWQDVLHFQFTAQTNYLLTIPLAVYQEEPSTQKASAVNTSSDFIWHLEKWLIFDTTGTKKHVSFPQSPLEAARKWAAAKMSRFHHDPVLVKPNDCWASHHFRSSNDPIDIYTVYIYISQSTLLDPQIFSIEIGQLN